jgi:hypothetical protein
VFHLNISETQGSLYVPLAGARFGYDNGPTTLKDRAPLAEIRKAITAPFGAGTLSSAF